MTSLRLPCKTLRKLRNFRKVRSTNYFRKVSQLCESLNKSSPFK